MTDVVRLAFAGPVAGHLEVPFEVVAKVATSAAQTVDGVASPVARSGLRRLGGTTDASVSVTIARAGTGLRVSLQVDARWGTPLGDLAMRLRRAVADALNASLGTTLDPAAVWVDFGVLRVEQAAHDRQELR